MALAVVKDLRVARALATAEDLEALETDVLAGFVLVRAVAGLSAPARERVSSWLLERTELLEAKPGLAAAAGEDGLWVGKRGLLTVDGITDVVLAVGAATGRDGIRRHALRHTYVPGFGKKVPTPPRSKELMGHESLDTTAQDFRLSAKSSPTSTALSSTDSRW
ncbi:hypothetical protein [Sphaerisporangium aureirubrum]|uniref:Tyr recombinase domain-containing protein n=1 Tax=Sphaerisporangium aureirubrum TaxID=1544736 RepID=A0ABW1NHY6_9ACTN